jgi:hypothetical protein
MRSLLTYEESVHFIAIFSREHIQVAQWLPVSASTATGSSEAMPFSKDFGIDVEGNQMLRALSRHQLSFHGVIGECPKGPQPNATTESLIHTGPPLGDLSQCSPTIVAPIATPNPNTAMALVVRTWSVSEEEWSVIKRVKTGARAMLDSVDVHAFAKALLLVRQVASPAEPDSEVALALRPLEISLAEAVGKSAHKMAIDQHWLNKDGPRAEFLRGCEVQFQNSLTPRLRSRMLLTYHKIYGSEESEGRGNLFNSKSFNVSSRRGHTRKKKETKHGAEVVQDCVLTGKYQSNNKNKKKPKDMMMGEQSIATVEPHSQNQGAGQPWCSAAQQYQDSFGSAGQPWCFDQCSAAQQYQDSYCRTIARGNPYWYWW